jgi:hypothetical protein
VSSACPLLFNEFLPKALGAASFSNKLLFVASSSFKAFLSIYKGFSYASKQIYFGLSG